MALVSGFEYYALLILRVILGEIFLYHGLPKIFSPKKRASGMGMPAFLVFLIGLAETLAALGAILGFYTEIAGLLIAIVMIGALCFKVFKWHVPFSTMKGMGWEFDLILLAAGLVLVGLGAGTISLDYMLGY